MKIGWLDYSITDQNKALAVLDKLHEKNAVDELGIASIRDGYADYFFPGTSTIQTHAKYFLIVPYILKDLENYNQKKYPLEVLLRRYEKQCAEILVKNSNNATGIIGSDSLNNNEWIKRLPSSIYWAGLKQYGIFLEKNYSIHNYLMEVDKERKLRLQRKENHYAKDDESKDDYITNTLNMRFIDMPLYKRIGQWREDISINLTRDEALFLKEKIIKNNEGTMLATVLKDNLIEFCNFKSFYDIETIIDRFPKDVQSNYYDALKFSKFMHFIYAVYNEIISNGNNLEAKEFIDIDIDDNQLCDFDIDRILINLKLYNQSNRLGLFIKNAQQALINKDLDKLKELIIRREESLKGSTRAKTMHPTGDTSWIGNKVLEYRFTIAKQMIKEIFEGEDNA